MKPPDPDTYLPQVLLSAYFGITILFSIVRRIRCTGQRTASTIPLSTNTQRISTRRIPATDTQRDGIGTRSGRVLYNASVLIITRLACIITITRMAMIEAGTSITKQTCSIFYTGIIDPMSTWSANRNSTEYPNHRKRYHINGVGIRIKGAGTPGRHDSRRATKNGRTRKLLGKSCADTRAIHEIRFYP